MKPTVIDAYEGKDAPVSDAMYSLTVGAALTALKKRRWDDIKFSAKAILCVIALPAVIGLILFWEMTR